jgi:large subunit ribosomal protein L21
MVLPGIALPRSQFDKPAFFCYHNPLRKRDQYCVRSTNVFAILRTGGKQYKVEPGQTIEVERLPYEIGQHVELGDVLMVSADEGVRVGAPVIEGARVRATVMAHNRGPKIDVFKYKNKKRYRRLSGHRQELTRLLIEAIEA